VALEGEPKAGCLEEEGALDFVQGRLSEEVVQRIDEHVDRCQRCRTVLAEAARALRGRATGAPLTQPAMAPASTALTRFAPGEQLSGRYRILRFIARGGMGEVYEAHDLMLNTRLALKTLPATISDDANAIRRLKQEVNLARLITHPNVCRIFDLGVHEQSGAPSVPGILFITMELVAGISLGDHVRKHGRMDGAAASPVARAIVAAIGAAHRANIIHRDLKSDNVMLATDEHGAQRVVVMDFGLARAASSASDMNATDGLALAGTLLYMAPEQLEGGPVSPVTDIYALGVVMYEMLTGRLPFRGEPAEAAAWRRVTQPAPPLDHVALRLDPRWRQIVAACLERDPTRRPRAAEQVAQLLQALDPSADTLLPISVSASARASRAGRRPGLAVTTVAALLTVVGAPTVMHQLQRQTRPAIAPHPVRMENAGAVGGAVTPPLPPPAPGPLPAPLRSEPQAERAPAAPSPTTAATTDSRAAAERRRRSASHASPVPIPPEPPADSAPVGEQATPSAAVVSRPSEDPDDGFVRP